MQPLFKCLAIIVSYNPEPQLLSELIKSLISQVSKIILIDNASQISPLVNISEKLVENIEYIQLSSNLGLGAAHNRGIAYGKINNYSHILIMDQDSLPAQDMVVNLYSAEQELVSQGVQIAAVGPQFISLHDNHKSAFIGKKRGQCSRIFCQNKENIKTEHLISSGSLISINSVKAIGQMNESLFIDLVDIEWGIRAKSLNYSCYGICGASMRHHLGDTNINVKFLNRRIVLSSSLRYYYHFRNALLLYRLPYVPWAWIWYHFSRHMFIKFIIIFFLPNRIKNMRMIFLGLWHGLHNKSGKLKE
ncbi:MAG: glycosyltransferase family 2 protein [Pseudomonadota bacterium]